ncbi:uncharacterized protein DS421_20g697240 [Arachis hypogaea]|nr:uncharacterized protein DS421_20g697240 [Arachis hypogaea]
MGFGVLHCKQRKKEKEKYRSRRTHTKTTSSSFHGTTLTLFFGFPIWIKGIRNLQRRSEVEE